MPTLICPTVEEYMETRHPLFGRLKLTRGIALLVSGSDVIEDQYPAQEDLGDYDFVYMGGHIHTITAAEAATLTAAGYGAYIT